MATKDRFYCIHVWASSQENLILLHTNNKGTYQVSHPCSQINAFVIHSLESDNGFSCYMQKNHGSSLCSTVGWIDSIPESRLSSDVAHLVPKSFQNMYYNAWDMLIALTTYWILLKSTCSIRSVVAQWQSAWLETEGSLVWASPASLHWGPWAK